MQYLLSLAVAVLCLVPHAIGVAQPATPNVLSVPQLLKNLESDNLRVASSAARSLGIIFSPSAKPRAEQAEVVEALCKTCSSPLGATLRKESAVALGRIRAKEAEETLKTALQDEDISVAIAAGESIGKILPVDEARTFLSEATSSESEHVQVAALHGLAPICKAEDRDVLLKGLELKNWRGQMATVKGLERAINSGAKLQKEDYDQIAEVFGSETANAANQTVHFFRNIRNKDAFQAVLKAAETKGDGSRNDHSWRTRTYALRTIYHWGWPTNQTALPVVIRNLGDPTANVTNEAKRILYGLQKEKWIHSRDLFPLYLNELEKAEPLKLRAGIMQEMGHSVEQHYASRVAKVAAATLEESMTKKEEWPARTASLTLIGASGYTANIEKVAENVGDNVTNVRNAAGHALKQLSSLCTAEQRSKVAPILQAWLDSPVDWRKTSIAARSVGPYAQSDSIPALSKLLSHSVINVREASSHSLVEVVQGKNKELIASAEQTVRAAMNANPQTWEYGSPVLGALKQIQDIPLLTKVLVNGQWRAQAAAAKAVKEIVDQHAIKDQALSEALIRAAQSDIIQVQDAANQALRSLTKSEAKSKPESETKPKPVSKPESKPESNSELKPE